MPRLSTKPSLELSPARTRDSGMNATKIDHEARFLARKIKHWHKCAESSIRKGLDYAHKCGLALLKAKEQVGHGHWLRWLADNVPFKQQRANEYMRLAEGWSKLPPGGDLSIKEALARSEEGRVGKECSSRWV